MGVPAVILRIDLFEFMDPSKVPSDSWFWGTFLNITVKCVVVTLSESAIYRISFILVDLGPLCCRKKTVLQSDNLISFVNVLSS